MAGSPTDWARLFSEVDEVKAILISRGITEAMNEDGILNRLEKINNCGRVNVVVDEIIAELNSEEPEVVVVDDGEDSSEVEVVYHGAKNFCSATDSTDGALFIESRNSPRGVKRHMANTLCSVSNSPKRSLTSTWENSIGDEETPVILRSPVVKGIVSLPTENAALPEEMGTYTKQQDQINYLSEMFPHAIPEFLRSVVENCSGDDIQLNEFVSGALENKYYLPTQNNNRPLSIADDETLPSCSKSVCTPRQHEVNNLSVAQDTLNSLTIHLEADSTTQSVQTEGAVGGVLCSREGIPGVSGSLNDLIEETSEQNEGEDNEREEKDDFEKSILYSEQLEYLVGVLPDADPTFLEDKISEVEGDANKLKEFVALALECPGGRRIYRTRGEIQRKQEHEAQVMKFTKNFSVEDFLKVFPDPIAHFEDPRRTPDLKVREHCLAYLKARYKCLYVNTICNVFRKENYNLSLTVKELDKNKYPKRKTKRSSSDCKLPENQCISFLQEVAYIENKKSCTEFIEAKKKRREEAKAKSELLTCNCCYDDELLSEDMSSCSDGHLFCIQCVKKGAEVIIGDGKTTFPCMQGDCKAEFSLSTLQGILAPSIFGKLVMRLQAEEVNAAGIEGLETCPSCPYSTIPAPEDKIFKCLNPECMKETCRICKESNHIPLKCEEVEKNDEVQARTYIENKMTEALIRTCWKCSRQFIKESGCNKMTCTCGALMCYICRKPVKDYKHFNPYKDQPSKLCPLYSDDAELHIQSVKTEAEKAKEEMMQQNPNINLKHDPTLKLPSKPSSSKGPMQDPLNPYFMGHGDNPLDFLVVNMHDYFHDRFNHHRLDGRGQQYQPNGNDLNNFGFLPHVRDHGYNIPPVYEVPPVIQVQPMPRNNARRVPHPPDYHNIRPYIPPNIPPYRMAVNDPVPIQLPLHIQPVQHHVYPPPPERHISQNSSKH